MTVRVAALCLLPLLLTACGGTKLIKPTREPNLEQPLVVATDAQLAASLDWVIVRNAPEAWARNGDWDEYLLRVQNRGPGPLRIIQVNVTDSSNHQATSLSDRKALVTASRETARRYKDAGVKVKAGMSGLGVAATGTGIGIGGSAVAVSTAAGTTSAGFAASMGLIFLAPVAITGGIIRGVRTRKVGNRIEARATPFPVTLASGQGQALDVFFPLAPSPQRVDIHYTDAQGEHTLTLDTSSTGLAGLHLGPPAETAASPAAASGNAH